MAPYNHSSNRPSPVIRSPLQPIHTRHAGRSPLARFTVALVLCIGLLQLAGFGTPVAAASCGTSGPSNGTYTITLCFTQPADGASLSDDTTVTVSVTTTGSAPSVRRVQFSLNGAYLLTDFNAPYTFTLPTQQWADGGYQLSAVAMLRDGFTTAATTIAVSFANGITSPPPMPTGFTPTTGTTPPSGQPFIVAAVGDGPDGGPNAGAVASLIDSLNPNLFLYLGDVYEKGTYTEFYNWYGHSGQLFNKYGNITNPIVGNHEYEKGQAPGYFRYWQNPPNYYSVDAGGWHFIALNSTSQFNQFSPSSGQYQWLAQDLQAHRDACTIVFFHHPRYSIGPQGDTPSLDPIWDLLFQYGVELVLVGHDHDYQRWTALDDAGQPHPTGVTQIVVGTGGHGIQNFVRSDSRVVKAFGTAPQAYGVLRLALLNNQANLAFVNIQNQTLDSTSVPCHGPNDGSGGGGGDTQAPTVPANLSATVASSTQVDLSWAPSTDDVGVAGYTVYRDGAAIATVDGATTSYADTTLAAGMTYSYTVDAFDAAGNHSAQSAPATVTTPTQGFLFTDGFETGDLSQWTSSTGLIVQQQEVFSGSYAARGTSTGSATYATKQLSSSQTDLYCRLRFKRISQGSNTVYLLRFRTGTGSSLLGLYVTSTGKLGFRNDVAGQSTTSSLTVTTGEWHEVQVHLVINGSSSLVEVWYDGTKVDALSKTQSLGTNPIGRIQLGENSTGRTYDFAFDEVAVDTAFIGGGGGGDTTPPETTITSAPPATTDQTSATFEFTASEPNSTFQCQLDGGTSQACTSPWAYSGLATGTHTFTVAATDQAGNTDPTPATYTWEITAAQQAPDTTLTSTPPSLTNQATATFSFTSDDPQATFECQLDASSFTACQSPFTTTTLAEGTHSFAARAVNAVGSDPSPATWQWTVDLTPPTAPADLAATVDGSTGHVTLTWTAATDMNGIAGYDVLRDGTLLAALGSVTSYTDSTTQPQTTYSYTVRARDQAGNTSPESAPATATTPPQGPLFSDDFESGTLSKWSTVSGLTITTEAPYSGSYAARGTSTGSATYALATLSQTASELYYRIWFNVVSQGSNTVYLLKFRTATNASLGGVYISSTGRLSYRSDVASRSVTTSTSVTQGTWHQLQVRLVTGSSGLIEIWYDGTKVVSAAENFGTNLIGRIQLGENSSGRTYDIVFDDVAAGTSFIP